MIARSFNRLLLRTPVIGDILRQKAYNDGTAIADHLLQRNYSPSDIITYASERATKADTECDKIMYTRILEITTTEKRNTL